jgi:hypothetical protein
MKTSLPTQTKKINITVEKFLTAPVPINDNYLEVNELEKPLLKY